MQNRREFTRSAVGLDTVVVAPSAAGRVRGRSRDVSLKGFFLETTERLAPGTECHAKLLLDTGGAALPIEVGARVLRHADGGMAFEITDVGLDAFEHLRQLVQANSAGDPDRVDAEFHEHVHRQTNRPPKR